MTLDEAIKHAEEVAKQNEEDAVIYSNCKKHKKNLYEIGLAENAEKKCCKCAEEHRRLAEWLKELKWLREQTRWIPVTERLPTENNSYLVWMPFTPEGHHITVAEWCGSYWNIKTPIMAWMPLPTPYREGEQDGKN